MSGFEWLLVAIAVAAATEAANDEAGAHDVGADDGSGEITSFRTCGDMGTAADTAYTQMEVSRDG